LHSAVFVSFVPRGVGNQTLQLKLGWELLYSLVSFSFHLRGVANRALWLNVRGLHPAAGRGSFSFGQRFLSFI